MNKYNWEEIQYFHNSGLSRKEIIKHFGCSKSAIDKATKRGVFKVMESRKRYNWINIQESYDIGLSLRDIVKKFRCSHRTVRKAVQRGDLKTRKHFEAIKLAYAQGKGKHKSVWTIELRKKQSELKKKFYQKNPEKHPNIKLSNNKIKMSYPEKLAYLFFKEKGIKFEHNSRVGKYWPDFIIGKQNWRFFDI